MFIYLFLWRSMCASCLLSANMVFRTWFRYYIFIFSSYPLILLIFIIATFLDVCPSHYMLFGTFNILWFFRSIEPTHIKHRNIYNSFIDRKQMKGVAQIHNTLEYDLCLVNSCSWTPFIIGFSVFSILLKCLQIAFWASLCNCISQIPQKLSHAATKKSIKKQTSVWFKFYELHRKVLPKYIHFA